MARTEARITCAIWDDEDYRDLTWEAQWLYKTLLTQKDLSLCGVLTWTPKRFAKLASNASASATRKALDLLRQKRYVVLDDNTDELLVRSLIRRDRVLGNHNSIVGCSKAFEAIHSGMVRDAIVEEVCRVVREGLAIGATEGGSPTGWLGGLPDHIRKRVGQPFIKAVALTCTRPPPSAPVPPASGLLPPASPAVEHASSSNLSSVADPPAEEDGRVAEAVRIVSKRRLVQRLDHDVVERYGPVNDRDEWLARTAERIRVRHRCDLADMAAEGVTVEAMVAAIEPLSAPPRPDAPEAHQWPDFEWVEDENGLAVERRVSA